MPEVTVTYPRIDAALAVVESELDVGRTEAEAFRSFIARLGRLQPETTAVATAGGGPAVSNATTVQGVNPATVRGAYRDTVLAMAHYDRDYGEPLLENVGLEFGPAVAELLATDASIPRVQLGLVEAAAEQARNERERFVRALEAERDSLETVRERLGAVERRLYEVLGRDEVRRERRPGSNPWDEASRGAEADRSTTLRELAAECQSHSEERQRALHQRPIPGMSGVDEGGLVEYLYGGREHRFPALAEVADVASHVEWAMERAL